MYDPAHEDAFNSAILLGARRTGGGTLRQGTAAGVRRIHSRRRVLSLAAQIPASRHRPVHRGQGARGDDFSRARRPSLAARPGDLLRRHSAGIFAQPRAAASQSSRQSHQRLMVRRADRALGTPGAGRVRRRRASRQHGARGQLRHFRAHRPERPRAAENLRRRSLPQPARRGRHRGRRARDAGRAYRVRGRGQFVRLSLHCGHADSRGPCRGAERT